MHHSKHQILLEKYIEKYSLLQTSLLCKVLFLFFYDEMRKNKVQTKVRLRLFDDFIVKEVCNRGVACSLLGS